MTPPPALRRAIAEWVEALRPRLPAARWARPEAMHLTLVFLGAVDAARCGALEDALAAACGRHAPFAMRCAAPGAFPPRGPVRVLWLGLEPVAPAPPGSLAALREAVAEAAWSVVPEAREGKPFRPHLTVARCRRPWPRRAFEAAAAAADGVPRTPFEVAAGTLFRSQLSPSGARHTALASLPLGASP